MKKLLVLLMAVMTLTLAFTACGKKDESVKEPTKTENTENIKTETTDDAPAEDDSVTPDSTYEGDSTTDMSEFESLVDTFTNSENEEEKEAARIELERILEQAEQQAQ